MIENKEHDYEYAVLIGIINQEQSAQQVSDYLDELAFLTLTAGGEVKKRFTQKLDTPHPKTFIGSGKMEDVRAYVKSHDISTVVFDDELTPAQQANIEELLKLSLIHISEPTRRYNIAYAVFCLKKNFFNDTATTEIYTRYVVGSVRCV